MKIIVAKNSGFCYGVKRALQLALATESKKSDHTYTWGELIHNPEVTRKLEARGIRVATSISQLKPGDTVIIRSHGVSPAVYRRLQKKGMRIIDATCPIVKKIQQTVKKLSQQSGELIIVGNRNHPEIQGLVGYSRNKALVIENEKEAQTLPHRKKRMVLAQSTQDVNLFSRIVSILLEKTSELTVYNTICETTRLRQESTAELASRVEAMIVVGGRNSSNTNKLYEISRRLLPRTYLIETPDEIKPEMLQGASRIGLSGGASTPPEVIKNTVAAIKNSFKQNSKQEKVTHDRSQKEP